MLCQLEPIPDTHDCHCTRCGTVFHDARPEELKVRCLHEGLGQPMTVRRWLNFGKALGRHLIDVTAKTAQGKLSEAYRTPEEIDAIFTEQCQPCPFFNGRICTHSKCGCNLGGQEKFLNKLKWRSETCPDERWI